MHCQYGAKVKCWHWNNLPTADSEDGTFIANNCLLSLFLSISKSLGSPFGETKISFPQIEDVLEIMNNKGSYPKNLSMELCEYSFLRGASLEYGLCCHGVTF